MHLSLKSLFRKRKKEDSTNSDCSNEELGVKAPSEQKNLPQKSNTQPSLGSSLESAIDGSAKEGSEGDINKDFKEPSPKPFPINQYEDFIEAYEKLGDIEQKIKEDQRELIKHFVSFQKELMIRAPKILFEEIKKSRQNSPVVKIPEIKEQKLSDTKGNGGDGNSSFNLKPGSLSAFEEPKPEGMPLPVQYLSNSILNSKGGEVLSDNFDKSEFPLHNQYIIPEVGSVMLKEIVLGRYEKSLLSRFKNMTKILKSCPSIDLKTYERISKFISKEARYYQNALVDLDSKLFENFFSVDAGDLEKRLVDSSDMKGLSKYRKESIIEMKTLYEQLLKLKTKENQLPEDEILDILKGKKVDSIDSKSAFYKDSDGRTINYMKGNHFWEVRCDNILKYFDAHKEQNLQLMDYVIDILSDESSKFKVKKIGSKNDSSERKVRKIDETLGILKNRYKSVLSSLAQSKEYNILEKPEKSDYHYPINTELSKAEVEICNAKEPKMDTPTNKPFELEKVIPPPYDLFTIKTPRPSESYSALASSVL